MSQNRSNAVMQRRREPKDSLDDFPTPSWATRAMIEHVIQPEFGLMRPMTCWEPACNRGYMARPLQEYFARVHTSDVHDYGWPGMERQADFLFPGAEAGIDVDWIITNPPFRMAEQFIERSFQFKGWQGTAMLVRSTFTEGVGRYERLFKRNPPSFIAQFAERVPMVKGRFDPAASTATAYCWLVWMEGEEGTRFVWIPPCRKQLEVEGDAA